MPNCGSQITICDLPVRFDTYKGCSHGCAYCFAQRKSNLTVIKKEETEVTLVRFILGRRSGVVNWCDWSIPLHWGGMSDPFQPMESKYRSSYKCLEVFAKTQYPFIVSTKGRLIGTNEYIALIKKCNCVIQISMACSDYDKMETGAPPFMERIQIAEKLAKYKRVNARIQPYLVESHDNIMKSLDLMAKAGIYGVIVEGMKFNKKHEGLVKIGADFCYDLDILKPRYEEIKQKAHELGMKFYCGENRLRTMGDSLTCCGVDGLESFKPNTFNLNHLLNGDKVDPTERMMQVGSGYVFKGTDQKAGTHEYYANSKFAEQMLIKYNASQEEMKKIMGK